MKILLTLFLLIPSLSWGIEKEELREELKYWKSLFDDGLITQEDYDNKKNNLLENFNEKKAITEKIKTDKEDISEKDLEIKDTSFFEDYDLNSSFMPTHKIKYGNYTKVAYLYDGPENGASSFYEFSNNEKVMSLNVVEEGLHKVKNKNGDIGYIYHHYLRKLDETWVEKSNNYPTNGNKDYSNKNDSKKESSSNNDSVAKELKKQNEILKQQLEYQKRRDEKKDFQKTMDNLGNLIDSITGSGKYYQPSNNQTCYNYGTALHPNIQCN